MDKPRILIVEDDLDLSEMVSSYFRVQNYEVSTAAWGEEALQIAGNHPLDLIMLDIRLPDIDGFELCRQLRGSRKTQDTPIIFLTEKRDRVDKLQGLELGVVDYITKPFDIQELRLRVRNAINRAQMPNATNPITDLPEGSLVDEHLTKAMNRDDDWAIYQLALETISEFRERYGFVAADDALRAIRLIIRNAVREFGEPDDFVGHLRPEHFIIITREDNLEDIEERIERRISQLPELFFPLNDQEGAADDGTRQRLYVSSGTANQSSGTFDSLEAFKDHLYDALS